MTILPNGLLVHDNELAEVLGRLTGDPESEAVQRDVEAAQAANRELRYQRMEAQAARARQRAAARLGKQALETLA